MGLVDGEDADRDIPQRLEEARRGEALRGHVEQAQLTGPGALDHLAVVGRVLLGVDQADPARCSLPERLDLVLHQGDQRRDDDREVVTEQGGQLVAERLSGAGGHNDQHVAALEGALDRLFLAGPEGVEAEDLVERGLRGGHGSGQAELRAIGSSSSRENLPVP